MTDAAANIADYAHLFLNDVPMMDVRAPIEFAQGAFPGAINVPLLDDLQRELIGTEYKQKGQEAAIALGLRLATPEIRAQRLTAWRNFIETYPQGVLYCFRGGLRSRTTQQWLRDQGMDYPLVVGGYKALRRFLIDSLEDHLQTQPVWLLSGRTGTGKTDVLQQLPYFLDLEGLAHHRGSTFGYTVTPQPAQISFENEISIGFLKHHHRYPAMPLVLEDESRLIGRLSLPLSLQEKMKPAPLLVLEASLAERENRVIRDYIVRQRQDYETVFGAEAAGKFAEFVLHNLYRIRNRLGGERHQQLQQEWSDALVAFESEGCVEGFRSGIRRLLVEYYDPMYDYQLSKKQGEILCRGDAATIMAWVRQQLPR